MLCNVAQSSPARTTSKLAGSRVRQEPRVPAKRPWTEPDRLDTISALRQPRLVGTPDDAPRGRALRRLEPLGVDQLIHAGHHALVRVTDGAVADAGHPRDVLRALGVVDQVAGHVYACGGGGQRGAAGEQARGAETLGDLLGAVDGDEGEGEVRAVAAAEVLGRRGVRVLGEAVGDSGSCLGCVSRSRNDQRIETGKEKKGEGEARSAGETHDHQARC